MKWNQGWISQIELRLVLSRLIWIPLLNRLGRNQIPIEKHYDSGIFEVQKKNPPDCQEFAIMNQSASTNGRITPYLYT